MTDCSQLEQEAAAILTWLKGIAEETGDFVIDQAPLVAQEAIAYGRVWHTMMSIAAVLLLVTVTVIVWWCARKVSKLYTPTSSEEIPYAVGGIMSLVAGIIVGFPLLAGHAHLAVKAWVAPRIYLIE
jgi:hypothetical protein